MSAIPLTEQVIVLDSALRCQRRENGPALYQQLDADFAGFAGCSLIAEHRFEADWNCWEMHPAGDEVLYLLQGAAEILLQQADGSVQSHAFDVPGSTLIVPRGVWHTARVAQLCRILFITPGAGTQNADKPPALPVSTAQAVQ